jgi:hypothetical protein
MLRFKEARHEQQKTGPGRPRQFTGSEHWYRHGLVRGILFTDGAKYVADADGAYWLFDEIAIAQRFDKAVAGEEFQVWKLTVNPDRSARLACDDGNGRTVFEKPIPYTDFPADNIELWFENSTIYPGQRRGRSCRANADRDQAREPAISSLP